MAKLKFDEADQRLYDATYNWLVDKANKNPKKGLPNVSNLLDIIKKILSIIFGLSNAKVQPDEVMLKGFIEQWVDAKKAANKKGISFTTLLILLFKIFEAVFDDFNTTG